MCHALPDGRRGRWAGRLPAVYGLRPVLPSVRAIVFSLLAEHQVVVTHACMGCRRQPGAQPCQQVYMSQQHLRGCWHDSGNRNSMKLSPIATLKTDRGDAMTVYGSITLAYLRIWAGSPGSASEPGHRG